jgi:hypothetical protein
MDESIAPTRNTSSEARQLILSVLSGVLVLIIEYWTGFFQKKTLSSDIRLNLIFAGLYTIFTVGSIWFISRSIKIWLRSFRYVREEYALAATLALLFTSALTLFSLFFRVLPWYIAQILLSPINGAATLSYEFRASDFVAIVSLQALIFVFIFIAYDRWNGLKSEKQVVAQERGDLPTVFSDAYIEIRRILRKEPPLKSYEGQIREYLVPIVDLSLKTSQWKDQALELFLISSTIYSFDVSKAWHEPPGCWIGSSRVGGLIVLYPSQNEPDRKTIQSVLRYARQILNQSDSTQLELVVLIKEGKSKKLKIDGQSIRLETEDSLIERLLLLDDYKETIRRRFEENLLPESNLALHDVYVEPKVTLSDNQVVDFSDYLQQWLNEPSTRQLVLLGEYGQGKSTAALAFAYHLLFNSNQQTKRIPILIELRGTSPATNRSTLGVLGDWGAAYGLNPKLLNYMNDTGKLLLIFEGFDEMSLLGDADLRQRHFSRLWGFATLRSKVLLTGRPNLFRGKTEMEQALGLNRPLGESFSCEAIRLAFFSVEQISQALLKYPSAIREQICLVSHENKHFYDMVSRPSLLHIVAVLWEQEGLSEKISRLNSAFVLDLFVRKSYRRPGRKDDPSSEYMILNSAERAYFMHGIAAYMVSKRLENQIDFNQLDQLIDRLIYAMPASVSESVSATSGETRIPLLKRFAGQESFSPDRNQTIELSSRQKEQIKTDVRTCGLLVDDPSSQGHFRFPYKLFMEYLFAATAAEQYESDGTLRQKEARSITHVVEIDPRNVLLPSLTACSDFFAELLISDELDKIQKDNLQQPTPLEIKTLFAKKMLLLSTRLPNKLGLVGKLSVILMTLIMGLGVRGILIYMLTALLFSMPAFLLIGLHSTGITRNNIMDSGGIVFWMSLSPLLAYGIFLIFSAAITRATSMRFWAQICKKQEVPPPVMHEILGTKFFVRKNIGTFQFWSD